LFLLIILNNGWAQNSGSAYFFPEDGGDRIFVNDDAPVNLNANPSAYVISGDSITVEAWVFPMSVPPHISAFGIVTRPYWGNEPWEAYKLQIWNFGSTDDPRFEFAITDGNVPANWGGASDMREIALGSWTHLAGTYDGSMVRLYVNGELVSENYYSGNIGVGDTGFFIGGLDWHFFHGLIDEVRLWNIARTQEEILTTINTTLNGDEPGLVGYWPLDEATEVNGNFPVTVELTYNHNDLWVDEPNFVRATPDSEVNIAPDFFIRAVPLPLYLGKDTLNYQPVVAGWPLPTISLISGPVGLIYNNESEIVHWIPVVGQEGQHTFTLQATNPSATVQGTYTVIVLSAYSENFNPHTITNSADAANSVYTVDVDADGDIDVLSASWHDDKIAWYENLMITNIGLYNQNHNLKIFRLYNNYPNPFNPSTTIEYSIPKSSNVEVSVYNIAGQKLTTLINKSHTPGNHQVNWDGSEYASGVYIYKINADNFVQSKKMLLIR